MKSRKWIVVVGIAGSFLLLVPGMLWVDQLNKLEQSEIYEAVLQARDQGMSSPEAEEAIAMAERLGNAGLAAFTLGLLSLVASFLAIKWPRIAAAIFAVSVVIPAFLVAKTLAFSFLLAIAAGLALRAPRRATPADA